MRLSKLDAEELLRVAMERELGPLLLSHSFVPSRGLGKYQRTRGNTKQRIWMTLRMPSYANDLNIAYVTGYVSIVMPNVNALAVELSGHDKRLLGGGEFTRSHQLGIVGPQNTLHEWAVTGSDEFDYSVRQASQFVSEYALPYLNEYVDASSLVCGFRNGDPRLLNDRPLVLYVAAALLVLGKPQEAYDVVNNAFGSTPGLAREYAVPLNFLRERVASKAS